MTPLHQAACERHTEAVRLLLELRVPLEPRDCRGNTPLELAKLWNHRAASKLLVLALWQQDKREQAEDLAHLRSLALLGAVRALEGLQKRLVANVDPNAASSAADSAHSFDYILLTICWICWIFD